MVYDAATRDAESDHQVEEIFEDEESVALREAAKTKWAALEKLVGAKPRIKEVAADLVRHFEVRIASLECKAMIVSMSRPICVELFDAIVEDSVKSSHSTNCRRLLSYRPSLIARLLQYVLIGVPINNGIKGLALRSSCAGLVSLSARAQAVVLEVRCLNLPRENETLLVRLRQQLLLHGVPRVPLSQVLVP